MKKCKCGHTWQRHTLFSGCLGNATPSQQSDCDCDTFEENE